MKKTFILFSTALLLANPVYAGFTEHYEAGQVYLTQYQYSSAIGEFKKALRINYLNNAAREALVNAYLARGTFYKDTDRNYASAANDFRAALFYMKYYPHVDEVSKSATSIQNATKNLDKCLSNINFSFAPESRYKTAQ